MTTPREVDAALLEIAQAMEAASARIDGAARGMLRLHNGGALRHDTGITGDALDDLINSAATFLGHASTQTQGAVSRLHKARSLTVHLLPKEPS